MKFDEKDVCSFPNWYPTFKKYTFKSVCIPVPEEVLEYLRKDVVTIPTEATLKKVRSENIDDITYSNWDSGSEDEDEVETPSFPQFSAQLKSTLDSFGGSAFIKMNWSAPTDAAWVATNNCLKCCNLQDAYLLLKCSDKISKDLTYSNDHYIIMKKWEDIHPGSEFRCFVINNELIAITQRSKSEFHRYILLNKFNIVCDIKAFFQDIIKNKLLINNFVFDVLWNSGSRVKLVDINTLNTKDVEGYLFTINDVLDLKYDEELSPEFRFIGEEIGIQPSNLSRHFGLPVDLTMSSGSNNLVELLQTQMDLKSNE